MENALVIVYIAPTCGGIRLSSQGVGSIGEGSAGQELAPVRARISPNLTGGEFDRFDLIHRPARPWARRQPPRLQTSDGVSLGLESTTPSFAPTSPRLGVSDQSG